MPEEPCKCYSDVQQAKTEKKFFGGIKLKVCKNTFQDQTLPSEKSGKLPSEC